MCAADLLSSFLCCDIITNKRPCNPKGKTSFLSHDQSSVNFHQSRVPSLAISLPAFYYMNGLQWFPQSTGQSN